MKLPIITQSLIFSTAIAMPLLVEAQDVTPEEARAIAKEAYIYGYPMVDSYRIQYGYFVDKNDPEYKGPWNEIHNTRAFTPRRTRPSRRPIPTRRIPGFRCGSPGRADRADDPEIPRGAAIISDPVHRRLYLQLCLSRQPDHR